MTHVFNQYIFEISISFFTHKIQNSNIDNFDNIIFTKKNQSNEE